MRKYILGVIALLNAAILSAGSLYFQPRPSLTTKVIFIGTSPADYYTASGWKIYNPATDPLCLDGEWPCLVEHFSFTNTTQVASALWSAGQPTISEDLAARSFIVLENSEPFDN
jgi:hypothetical protein